MVLLLQDRDFPQRGPPFGTRPRFRRWLFIVAARSLQMACSVGLII